MLDTVLDIVRESIEDSRKPKQLDYVEKRQTRIFEKLERIAESI